MAINVLNSQGTKIYVAPTTTALDTCTLVETALWYS